MASPAPSWEYVPGLLELMEDGAASPEDVADREHAAPATRGQVGPVARQLWDWLRGFRRQDALCEHAPIWIPLAELWPAPDSTAELTYEVAQEQERNAEISIVPAVGFGGFSRHELAREVTLPADRHGVVYETRVYLTVLQYANERTGETLLRVDVDAGGETPEYNARDLSDDLRPWNDTTPSVAELRAAGHTVMHIERRADRSSATDLTWTSKTMCSWSVKAGLDVPGVPATLALSATCQRAEGFTATFALPGRLDYALCARQGEAPIVPQLIPITPE